jgi:hypothetical protein
MEFYHGGKLSFIDESFKYKSNRVVYGAGLYLTTYYDVAKKYTKGSRKLYKIELNQGNDISDSLLPYDKTIQFLKGITTKSKLNLFLNRIERFIIDGKKNVYNFFYIQIFFIIFVVTINSARHRQVWLNIMKKIILFLALSLTALTATAQLTKEEKNDPMRPKGMIQVGFKGHFDREVNDAVSGLLITRYYLSGNIVGYRFLVVGSHSYRYYWKPKFCSCSQEQRKIDE